MIKKIFVLLSLCSTIGYATSDIFTLSEDGSFKNSFASVPSDVPRIQKNSYVVEMNFGDLYEALKNSKLVKKKREEIDDYKKAGKRIILNLELNQVLSKSKELGEAFLIKPIQIFLGNADNTQIDDAIAVKIGQTNTEKEETQIESEIAYTQKMLIQVRKEFPNLKIIIDLEGYNAYYEDFKNELTTTLRRLNLFLTGGVEEKIKISAIRISPIWALMDGAQDRYTSEYVTKLLIEKINLLIKTLESGLKNLKIEKLKNLLGVKFDISYIYGPDTSPKSIDEYILTALVKEFRSKLKVFSLIHSDSYDDIVDLADHAPGFGYRQSFQEQMNFLYTLPLMLVSLIHK